MALRGTSALRLDALFLATPISWDGNVTQRSGRLHREHKGKANVIVYDYVDATVPMLDRMYKKRLKTYANPNAPTGFAIFDRQTVWYGSLPLLAYPRTDDCSLRFTSAEVAHTMSRR